MCARFCSRCACRCCDAVHRFEFGCAVGAGIPGAHFAPLPGKNHMPLAHDPAMPRILDEIRRFLGATRYFAPSNGQALYFAASAPRKKPA